MLFRPAARGIAPPALRLGLSGSIDVLKLNGPYSVRGTGWVALQPLSAILYSSNLYGGLMRRWLVITPGACTLRECRVVSAGSRHTHTAFLLSFHFRFTIVRMCTHLDDGPKPPSNKNEHTPLPRLRARRDATLHGASLRRAQLTCRARASGSEPTRQRTPRRWRR